MTYYFFNTYTLLWNFNSFVFYGTLLDYSLSFRIITQICSSGIPNKFDYFLCLCCVLCMNSIMPTHPAHRLNSFRIQVERVTLSYNQSHISILNAQCRWAQIEALGPMLLPSPVISSSFLLKMAFNGFVLFDYKSEANFATYLHSIA